MDLIFVFLVSDPHALPRCGGPDVIEMNLFVKSIYYLLLINKIIEKCNILYNGIHVL